MDTWSNICWTWRHRHRFTQEQAGKAFNVSLTTWSRWERGRTEPVPMEARRVINLMALEDRRLSGPPLPPGIYKGDDAITIIGGRP